MNTNRHEFMLETLVDFPDDAIGAPEPISEKNIDAMMRRLADCGVCCSSGRHKTRSIT